MNTISQGEAVFQAVSKVFDVSDAVPPTTQWTATQKDQVHSIVLGFFKDGTTIHKSNPGEAALIKYIPGLVNNWVRKDKRLNGGVKYETKNPGSRAGSSDETLKALKQLLNATRDPTIRVQVEAAISERMEQLKPKVEINVEALPEALRHLVK